MATHSEETKAAVLAALLAGQSVSAVAREFKLPRSTIIGWRNVSGVKPTAPDSKKEELGELIAEYLRENLTTLREQQKFFRSFDWLRSQGAESLAVLHGVSADKAIRILGALEGGDDERA